MDDIRAKQNVVFSVLALLFNILSFVLITMSPYLRKISKFHIITSMSIANILACLAFFPDDTHYALHKASYTNDKFRIFLQGVQTYCMPSVLSVSLVCLGVDYMVNRVYNIRLQKKIITSVVSITVSWSFGFLSLLPFSYLQHPVNATTDSLPHDYHNTSNIYISATAKLVIPHTQQYKRSAQVPVLLTLMTYLWGILPLIFAFLTSIFSLCVLLRQIYKAKAFPTYLRTQSNSSSNYGAGEHIREISILDTVVSTVIVIILTVPFYVESLTSITCTAIGECFVKAPQNRSSELARWSVTFILPALWMIDAHFREAFILLCDKIGFGACVVYY